MGNQDLFKEALLEAKTIREAAIANAKAALEETITPHLKSILSQRLMEMEKEEDGDEVNEEEEVDEMEGRKGNFNAQTDEPEDFLQENEDEAEDDSEKSEDEAEEKEDEEEKDKEAEEEDMEVKDMEIEDLRELIRDIVSQEMGGMDGMGAEEELPVDMDGEMDMDSAMDGEPQPDDMVSADDEEIDLDELLAELEGLAKKDSVEEAKKKHKEKEDKEKKKMEKDLKEAIHTINTLRSELSEVNLLNAKLLYLNKVLKAGNLSEGQKAGLVTAFDKASSIKEVKLVYETVKESFKKPSRTTLREHKGFASKPTGVAPKREVINEVDQQILRMQKLAGIIK